MNRNNPACWSPLLDELFPPGVVTAEFAGTADAALLLPEDRGAWDRADAQSVSANVAGRLCARRALEPFGLADAPLRSDDDDALRWPPALIGSLAQAPGYSAAAVAERRRFRALGLAARALDRAAPDVPDDCFLPTETRWLASLAAADQARIAALLACAKDAARKCLFGLLGRRPEYAELALDLAAWQLDAGGFALRPQEHPGLHALPPAPLLGRFAFRGNLVCTGIALASTAD